MFIADKTPLYIGKSVSLRARVKSHIQNAKHDAKERAIIESSDLLRFAVVDNDFNALLLEAQMIQKFRPRYNVELKDDKSYLYITIDTGLEFPKPSLIRGRDRKTKKGVLYFGPFPSTRVAEELLRSIRRFIPFCSAKNITKRPCFHSRIELCNPCPNAINKLNGTSRKKGKSAYRASIRRITRILLGNTDQVMEYYRGKLLKLSRAERFEEALTLRNKLTRFQNWIDNHSFPDTPHFTFNQTETRLQSLQTLLKENELPINSLCRIECYDASTLLFTHSVVSMVVLTNGAIDKSEYRRFRIKIPRSNSDFSMLKEALTRRLRNRWPLPDLIIVDGGKPQVRAFREVLDRTTKPIPLIGLAKAPDRIILGLNHLSTIKPPGNHPGFNLLKLARDESHRFANSYRRLLEINSKQL